MVKDIFYQSSFPRAGSTLLQNILGQNPDFYVTPTSGLLELLAISRAGYTKSSEFKAQDKELMKDGWLSLCKGAMYGFFNGLTDKPYAIDKSRGWGANYNFLKAIHNKEPKIICMIRDPRAVFASMEKNFRKHPERDDGTIRLGKMEGITTENRVKKWVSAPPVGLALDRLEQMITEDIDRHILFIKFEDLVTNPKFEIERVYKYLELPNFEHDFNHVEQITHEDDSVYGIYGDHIIKNEVKYFDPKYNEILGEGVCRNIVNSYQWFYNYFKYEK
jgi:sulfotransferase